MKLPHITEIIYDIKYIRTAGYLMQGRAMRFSMIFSFSFRFRMIALSIPIK